MTVILIGYADYRELSAIETAVTDHGEQVTVWDVQNWPGEPVLTYDVTGDNHTVTTDVDFEDITGVLAYRNYLFSPFEQRFKDAFQSGNGRQRAIQLIEWRSVIDSFIAKAETYGATVIDHPRMAHWHDSQIEQLHRFHNHGVAVPETVFSNDPETAREFINTHGEVVAKPVADGLKPQKITTDDVSQAQLEKLAVAPVQFQEYIPGDDIRVYFIDGEIISTTQYITNTWSHEHGGVFNINAVTLPDAVMNDVQTVANISPIQFGAIDVRIADTDTAESYGVLESNPHPRFIAHEEHTDNTISDAIAAYLCSSTLDL